MERLFIDIETHRVKEFNELTPELNKAWTDRYLEKFKDEYIECNTTDNTVVYQEKSALFAEFSQVICITVGAEFNGKLMTTSFYGKDEINDVLIPFVSRINKWSENHDLTLVGWNINGFDKPYLIKRLIINNLDIPQVLKTYKLKPWECRDLDLMNFWKFGGIYPTTLEAAAASLGIKSKSEKFDGRTLFKININDMDWNELSKYCKEDVTVTYQIFKRLEKYIN